MKKPEVMIYDPEKGEAARFDMPLGNGIYVDQETYKLLTQNIQFRKRKPKKETDDGKQRTPKYRLKIN
jgi:hypothetical protein